MVWQTARKTRVRSVGLYDKLMTHQVSCVWLYSMANWQKNRGNSFSKLGI
jgi:hypothetical protein